MTNKELENSIKIITRELKKIDKTNIKALKFLKELHDQPDQDQQIKNFCFNLYQLIQK